MTVKKKLLRICNELEDNAQLIDNRECEEFIRAIRSAKHIFLSGAGRSGIVVKSFANRLLHLGFSVSIIGEISSPHSAENDLLIICSSSGETDSLSAVAKKAFDKGVNISLVTSNSDSSIGKLSKTILKLPGKAKTDTENIDGFSQPMGTLFEQLAFFTFDAIILSLMDELNETSASMFKRHADFE